MGKTPHLARESIYSAHEKWRFFFFSKDLYRKTSRRIQLSKERQLFQVLTIEKIGSCRSISCHRQTRSSVCKIVELTPPWEYCDKKKCVNHKYELKLKLYSVKIHLRRIQSLSLLFRTIFRKELSDPCMVLQREFPPVSMDSIESGFIKNGVGLLLHWAICLKVQGRISKRVRLTLELMDKAGDIQRVGPIELMSKTVGDAGYQH